MKKSILTFLLLAVSLCGFQAFASAPMCSEIFAPRPVPKYFSPRGLQYFRSPSLGKDMAYDYKHGKKRPVWILIHGLGDDMSKLQEITSYADAEGYGTLRVDLFGHGESLKQLLARDGQIGKESFYYFDNVVVLKELIQYLKLEDVVIVGHSYGGGISYTLAAELLQGTQGNPLKVRSLHMLAPYVQRIDKFLQKFYQSSEFLLHQTAKMMGNMGTKPATVTNILQPLFLLSWNLTLGMRYMHDYMASAFQFSKWEDLAMDTFLDRFMTLKFRDYFVARTSKDKNTLTPEEKEDVDLQVAAAIKVTKGARDLDLLDTSHDLQPIGAPVQVMGGDHDALVIPPQLQEFSERLSFFKMPHRLEFLRGAHANHFFPQSEALETYKNIRAFQDEFTP